MVYRRSAYVNKLIKGFKRTRIPKRRLKKPWSVYHTRLMMKHACDLNNYNEMALSSGVMLGYHGLMRTCEYGSVKGPAVLTREQIEFLPNMEEPTDAVITINTSKQNKEGRRELIAISCVCKRKYAGEWCPCGVHHLKRFVTMRDSRFGSDPSAPLLLKANEHNVSYENMRMYLRDVIHTINTMEQMAMNPVEYTPHTLRVGGCTDMVRNGEPGHMVEQQGRWSSKVWKTTYLNLDWRDIVRLSGKSIHELRSANRQPFVDC